MTALVLIVHLWCLDEVVSSRLGEGSASTPPPPPISVEFVRTLLPSQPPVSARGGERGPSAAPAPARSASDALQPLLAEPAPSQPEEEHTASASTEASEHLSESSAASVAETGLPQNPSAAASAPDRATRTAASAAPSRAAPASAAQQAEVFDWPPSTRLVYSLSGQYRGPLYGSAQVEWLRQDQRYQVRLLVKVSPFFERRILSDGVIGPDGLSPRRYDQETDFPLRETRRETLFFQSGEVILANGQRVPSEAGLQDSASQFVQLTWRFLTHPEQLEPGRVVEFPLALPRRVGRWRYQAQTPEMLALPFGEVEAVHLRPDSDNSRPNELRMAVWLAPSLQYLPVKIVLRLDDDTYLDMLLKDRPAQAAP